MKHYRRRTFLSSIGTAIIGTGLCSTVSAASTTVLKGQVVDYNGDPIPHRHIAMDAKAAGHVTTVTDGEGWFEEEVEANTTYMFGFYKYKYGPHPSEPDGVPHVYSLGGHSSGSDETNLGKLHVEEAHLVEVQALDADGNPVGNCDAELYAHGEDGDYWGTGPGTLTTNHNGFVVVDDAPYTGIELVRSVEFSISIPSDDGSSREYSKDFYVDEPLSITVQIGEGMTVEPLNGSSSETSEPTPTETPEETPEEATDTPTATQTETPSTTADASTERPTTTPGNDVEQRRGFFSNDTTEEELGMLSDPFTLTVGGFILSAGGIAHQLIRGR